MGDAKLFRPLSDASPLSADELALLPDIVRLAAKDIANEPALWCQGQYHRQVEGLTTASCALGYVHIELVNAGWYDPDHSTNDEMIRVKCGARALIDNASDAITGGDCGIVGVNDNDEATPDSVAEHLLAVADRLEFGA